MFLPCINSIQPGWSYVEIYTPYMCSWAMIVYRDKSAYITVYLASLLSQQIPYTQIP